MGKQIQLHLLADDCKQLLNFIQERDPVIVTSWTSHSIEVEEAHNPWDSGGWFCLWNQALLPSLRRTFIPESQIGAYYRVDSSFPVIEFSHPSPLQEVWNGRTVRTQGRLWAGFECKNEDFERWYNAIIRWIRKNFVKNPVPLLGGYVGPAAYDWFKNGGLLLPQFLPPLTSQWLSWAESQDQHRAVFSKHK